MLTVILQFLAAKFQSLSYIQQAFGLGAVTNVNGQRVTGIYEGNELQQIAFDSYKSMCFVLKNGTVNRDTQEHRFRANVEIVTETYPLRVILYSQGAETINCESQSQSIAQGIKKALSGVQEDLRSAINCELVTIRVTNTELDKNAVWAMLYEGDSMLKDSDILIAIDIEVAVGGNEYCFAIEPCEAGSFVFDYAAQSFCSLVTNCTAVGKAPITFYTTADKTLYTSGDVTGIGRIAATSDIAAVIMDGTALPPSFWSFTTGFQLSNVTVYGGEYVVIFLK